MCGHERTQLTELISSIIQRRSRTFKRRVATQHKQTFIFSHLAAHAAKVMHRRAGQLRDMF